MCKRCRTMYSTCCRRRHCHWLDLNIESDIPCTVTLFLSDLPPPPAQISLTHRTVRHIKCESIEKELATLRQFHWIKSFKSAPFHGAVVTCQFSAILWSVFIFAIYSTHFDIVLFALNNWNFTTIQWFAMHSAYVGCIRISNGISDEMQTTQTGMDAISELIATWASSMQIRYGKIQ